jgi:hypothetical protein
MVQINEVSITGLMEQISISDRPASPKPKKTKNRSNLVTKPKMDRKYFGIFNCECGEKWASAHAWWTFAQNCHACDEWMVATNLYGRQRRPKRGSTAHDQSGCRKCDQVGNCATIKTQET